VFTGCLANPDNCALAHRNLTAEELEQAVWDLLDHLKYNPVTIGNILLDYTLIKGYIIQNMYDATGWRTLAVVLDVLLATAFGDRTGHVPPISTIQPGFLDMFDVNVIRESTQFLSSVAGIHCGERKRRFSTLEELMPVIRQLYGTSRLLGDVTVGLVMQCARWQMEAKERYEGNFKVKTKGPILILSNTFDGHTPIKSARNVSEGFEGSVLLEINGYGVSLTRITAKRP
jgi:hypothetical protein